MEVVLVGWLRLSLLLLAGGAAELLAGLETNLPLLSRSGTLRETEGLTEGELTDGELATNLPPLSLGWELALDEALGELPLGAGGGGSTRVGGGAGGRAGVAAVRKGIATTTTAAAAG